MSAAYDMDYDSEDDEYDYDLDYIYADAGAFDLADELASAVIPDPAAQYYRDDELEEYDNYNFWSEIEYGNNEIFDQDTPLSVTDTTPADKKKKSRAEQIKDTIKKIRLRGIQDYPTVLWKSSHDAATRRPSTPVYDKPQQSTAVLPNWRQLPAFTASSIALTATRDNTHDEEWEDMSEDDDKEDADNEKDENDDEEDEEDDIVLGDVDPDMLKSALAARLSASGMTAKDQSVMMEAMMQMLAGGEGADTDNLLETLTSNMLNQVTEEGGDSSMGQWLSGQGVSLEEPEADEQDHETTASPSLDSSPKDSVAAEPPAAPKSSEQPVEALLEHQSTGQKRKHPLSEGISQDQVPDPAPSESARTSKRIKQAESRSSKSTTHPQPSARKPAFPQTRGKVADVKPTATSTAIASAKIKTEQEKITNVKPQSTRTKEGTKTTDESAKTTTRKRKASDEQVPEEKPKRQLRNFAAPTASSQSKVSEGKTSAPKTARSGKAKK